MWGSPRASNRSTSTFAQLYKRVHQTPSKLIGPGNRGVHSLSRRRVHAHDVRITRSYRIVKGLIRRDSIPVSVRKSIVVSVNFFPLHLRIPFPYFKYMRGVPRWYNIPVSHFVYILQCADRSLYVGCTNNLKQRIEQHSNSKKGAHYTKIRRPVTLVHSEKFKTLAEARRRESEIKKWPRDKKLVLVKKVYRTQSDRLKRYPREQ